MLVEEFEVAPVPTEVMPPQIKKMPSLQHSLPHARIHNGHLGATHRVDSCLVIVIPSFGRDSLPPPPIQNQCGLHPLWPSLFICTDFILPISSSSLCKFSMRFSLSFVLTKEHAAHENPEKDKFSRLV